jgi:hypothetical protein
MLNTLKPNSDFIIDGSLSTTTIVNKILEELKKIKKKISSRNFKEV